MTPRPIVVGAVVALACLLSAIAHAADLSTAKALYVAASYEEALEALATVDLKEGFEEISQIRALCLLALGRTPAAEQAVQELVLRNPAYKLNAGDVSPKFVELFNDVRRRTMPMAVRGVYVKAKAHYDARRWPEAAREFSGLITLLADPELLAQQPAFADLRELGEGFLRLSEVELAIEARRRAESTPIAPPIAEVRPAAVPAVIQEPLIYSGTDADVTPPVELQKAMPGWFPTNPLLRLFSASGLLELVIDETGAVERATVLKRTTPAYDELLVRAARTWTYQPARKGTQAVRYRHVIQVNLRPPE